MMLRKTLLLSFIILLTGAWYAHAATVDPVLLREIAAQAPDAWVDVYIVMKDQVDIRAMNASLDARNATRLTRHYEVITALKEKAANTQYRLLAEVQAAEASHQAALIKPFWIHNAIGMSIKPSYLETLKNHPDIDTIYFDYPIELIHPVRDGKQLSGPCTPVGTAPENNVVVSRAPELWAMGIDGTGALACDQDAGADGTHPAFASRWRCAADPSVPWQQCWFDPNGTEQAPFDDGSIDEGHGTHTLGIMVGAAPNAKIGMAPGAQWIAARTIDYPGSDIFTEAVAAFQWAADPTGNPGDLTGVPDVINNSWGIPQGMQGWSACMDTFNASIDAAEASGAVVVFAAGNEGQNGPSTIRAPADRAIDPLTNFSVGCINQDATTICYFSSLGPTDCTDSPSPIKPEVVGVGMDVCSSMPVVLSPPNLYQYMSGTSMATPQVAGAVLLLRSAYPDATVAQVKEALYMSAVYPGDRPAAGEDNTFGRGRIDCVAAYDWLTNQMASPDGKIFLDRPNGYYSCDADTIKVQVNDTNVGANTLTVTVSSNTEPSGVVVTLTAGDPNFIYKGSVTTSGSPAQGDLQMSDGDTITATYIDADNGNGGHNIAKTVTATAACAPPVFAGLTGATAGDGTVALTWNPATDPHGLPLSYNVFCSQTSQTYDWNSPLANTQGSPYNDNSALNGNTYYYVVRAMDSAHNQDSNTVEFSASPVGPDHLFVETFDDKNISQWTITNNGCAGGGWTDTNPGGRSSNLFSGKFGSADTTGCQNPFGTVDSTMDSPAISTQGHHNLELRFAHSFQQGAFERPAVFYSVDNGAHWKNLITYYQTDESNQKISMPIDADWRDQLKIRYYYHSSVMFGGWWGVDTIMLVGWKGAPDDDDDNDDNDDNDNDDNDDDASPSDDDVSPDDDDDNDTSDDDNDTTDDDVSPADDDVSPVDHGAKSNHGCGC